MRFEGCKNPTTVLPVYLAFFLDSFGLAIIYPVLTPLFLRPGFSIFLPDSPLTVRVLLLGFTIAAFPLAQLFGAPLIGETSDTIGKKRSFIITISGTTTGYFLTAIGIFTASLPLVMVGRLWTGFFAGNLTLCLATIAELSPDAPTRTRNFGKLASLGGVSFVLGILAGGSLSGASVASYVDPGVPFWLMTFLSIINLIFIILFYQEPLSKPSVGQFHIWRGVQNIASAFKEAKLRRIYCVFFFFMICWITSMQFVSAYLINVYLAGPLTLEFSLVGVGLVWSLTNGFLTKKLSYHFKAFQILLFALPLLCLLLLLSSFELPLWLFLSCFAASALCSALIWTSCLSAVSLMVEEGVQGRILGINQSIGALAAICGPIAGGFLAGFGIHWIYVFTAFFAFLAFIIIMPKIINDN